MDEASTARRDRRSFLAPRVVGRDVELALLAELLEAAAEGRGSMAFVVGEAGIGKSRLVEATAAEARRRRGLPVLRGRAVQAATPVAYRPVAEALCSLVRTGGGPARGVLAPFDAILGALIPDWRTDDTAPVDQSVVTMAEAVLRFLTATAAAHGCLLILEDLHWADPETLAIVEYLADNLAGEPVLCAVTWRTDERQSGLEVLRALDARRASRTIALRRLDEGEVADMVSGCLGPGTVPDAVHALATPAEGVPFLVEELLATALASGLLRPDGDGWLVSPGPSAVVPLTFLDTVRRRLTDVGPAPRSVLLAGALLGRRFEWRLLPSLTGLDEEATVAGLRAAIGQGLVEADPDPALFRFRHALTRDAVLADALPPERATVAARAHAAVEAAFPG
ncbi:MAG TPA: AAA family ATPase, partial [Acidimicrobiales bacterium]